MTRLMMAATAAALALCGAAQADFFLPGEYNGWDLANAPAMSETAPGSGVFTYSFAWSPNTRTEVKITGNQGDWDSGPHPEGNNWLVSDGSGNTQITLDTNSYADGWSPASNRVYSSTNPSTWTATGSFLSAIGGSDWDNASAQGAMSASGGFYRLVIPFIADGTYDWKPVVTGSWDSVGSVSSNNVNANNAQFTTGGGNNTVYLDVDPSNGTIRSTVVPAPAAASALGLAGLAGLRRRRR